MRLKSIILEQSQIATIHLTRTKMNSQKADLKRRKNICIICVLVVSICAMNQYGDRRVRAAVGWKSLQG